MEVEAGTVLAKRTVEPVSSSSLRRSELTLLPAAVAAPSAAVTPVTPPVLAAIPSAAVAPAPGTILPRYVLPAPLTSTDDDRCSAPGILANRLAAMEAAEDDLD